MVKLTREEELLILEQGIKTAFWELITSKWEKFLKHTEASLISPNYSNRDFLAGKVRGMKDLLNYPMKHIETLQNQMSAEKEQKVD